MSYTQDHDLPKQKEKPDKNEKIEKKVNIWKYISNNALPLIISGYIGVGIGSNVIEKYKSINYQNLERITYKTDSLKNISKGLENSYKIFENQDIKYSIEQSKKISNEINEKISKLEKESIKLKEKVDTKEKEKYKVDLIGAGVLFSLFGLSKYFQKRNEKKLNKLSDSSEIGKTLTRI